MHNQRNSWRSKTNFVTYCLKENPQITRVGHLDFSTNSILPLSYASGTALSTLYEVIELGPSPSLIASHSAISLEAVKILPPLPDRDVLAVGKNYAEHAKEFNASGYDASDKIAMPSHSVIFTKRATSIVAHEEDILLLSAFTQTLDYEGEIGIIIGRSGHKIEEGDAWDYVWGYTIINDVTAREKQRDHKQFFIGKSGDTFCPMGPVAVQTSAIPKRLQLQTKVNGEIRQQGSTDDLIFSIPRLIKVLSEAQTIRPGDVIATGTPAGVGFGLSPPQFLKPYDVVEISVTGLGTLRNTVASLESPNYVQLRIEKESVVPTYNLRNKGAGLTTINNKLLYAQVLGSQDGEPVVYVHGLGGSHTQFLPLIHAQNRASKFLSTHKCVLLDLEGQGLSPTRADSVLSLNSFVADLKATFDLPTFGLQDGATIVAQSMGCLIAMIFVSRFPHLVKKLVLLGPPELPLASPTISGLKSTAAAARERGMHDVAHRIASSCISLKAQEMYPMAYTVFLQGVLTQDSEGFAKACMALAGTGNLQSDFGILECQTLIVTGEEDTVSSKTWCQNLARKIGQTTRVMYLPNVGHCSIYEDVGQVSGALEGYL